jgi:hypothetical protein
VGPEAVAAEAEVVEEEEEVEEVEVVVEEVVTPARPAAGTRFVSTIVTGREGGPEDHQCDEHGSDAERHFAHLRDAPPPRRK